MLLAISGIHLKMTRVTDVAINASCSWLLLVMEIHSQSGHSADG